MVNKQGTQEIKVVDTRKQQDREGLSLKQERYNKKNQEIFWT
jgi:hypothetical protein